MKHIIILSLVTASSLLLNTALAATPDDEVKQMREATKFAHTLALAALPSHEFAKIHVVHNKENGAASYACHVELATNPMIVAGKGGNTPERACYLAIDKVKAILEKTKQ